MTVHLVGAGPGDPGLIAVRGAELLRGADVVVHDRSCAPELLDLVADGAEVIQVDEVAGHGADGAQAEVVALLVELGVTGRSVVRLIEGDPFAGGAGAAEAGALIDAGIDIEVVPGIPAAIAAPSAAGIPLMATPSSPAFTVVVAGEDRTARTDADWERIGRLGGTIVVVDGVGQWPTSSAGLMAGGLAPDTPAAAVRWGTRPEQETVRATLATLGDHDLRPPSIIVVGDVASVDVGWLERMPLFGRRVVVTRTRAQASELTHQLRRRGAAPVEVPTIEIVEPVDGGAAMRAAAATLDAYDWVVFTSPNGASRFCEAIRDARAFGAAQIAAIGPGTARVLEDRSIAVDLVPDRYVAEGLLEAFPAPSGGGRVLLARAAEARDVLPDGLRGAGWDVDVVEAYRTVRPDLSAQADAALTDADVVTFTSSSTVRHFLELVGLERVPATVACIGPVTAATARELGLTVAVEAPVHTIAGLVDALEAHFRS